MDARTNPSTIRMAPRYVIRTIDEDWIDLFDPPSRIDDKRAAWDEAKRRVREHPELKTVVLDRRTGATLWQSDPDIPARYEVLAVDATVFYALETDLPLPGDVLSSHKEKDDAWTAFYEAIKEPVGDDIIVLRDTVPAQTVIASSSEDAMTVCAGTVPRRPSSRPPTRTSTAPMRRDGGDSRSSSDARQAVRHAGGRLGASLRDRATLPSPLRGLVPSGGYPSRLRSQARCALRLPRAAMGELDTPPDVGPLSHTCSVRQPRRRRGPPLRCAPFRPGLAGQRRWRA